MRKNLKYIALLAGCLILLISARLLTPRPVDWSPSFSRRDAIPYGCHILREILSDLFPGRVISTVHDSAYDTLKGRSFRGVNYIFINGSITFDKYDMKELKRFVSAGNSVFVAAALFDGGLADELGLKTAPAGVVADAMTVSFTNRALKKGGGYAFRRGGANIFFAGFRQRGVAVLGVNELRGVNFIRVSHGRGAFYLSSIPLAYTNYGMLTGDSAEYAFKSLSYLPVRDTLWDEYYKSGRSMASTPLRFILSRESLTWAYYTGLAGLALFVFFRARRTQRIIPEIGPPVNATLDFARTVGRLYYQRGDHKNIAEKKILYFFDQLHARYQIDAFHRGEDFYRLLSNRTGISEELSRRLVDSIDRARSAGSLADGDLEELNGRIEQFESAMRGKKT